MANMTWRDAEHALQAAINDAATGWSLGTFGALAEFHRDADEDARIETVATGRSVVTERGALRVDKHSGLRLVPYEGLSKNPTAWMQGVMVCLPEADAAIGAADGLTDLGADIDALTDDGRNQRLFDLGLGVPHVQPCLRTDDAALVDVLRAHLNIPFLHLPQVVVAAIKAAQPARVFQSNLGRIEVTASIPARGGETPLGPHTHILPELLGRGRNHSANVPVPEGWVPGLAFYPPNAARDARGEITPFDRAVHDRFQALIEAFAPAEIVAAKALLRDSMSAGTAPEDVELPTERATRTALRVALRQWWHLHGESELWHTWRAICEPAPLTIDQ